MGRMGDAWDVAYAGLFLASDEVKYITGTEQVVDGGLTVNCVWYLRCRERASTVSSGRPHIAAQRRHTRGRG
jgi:Enoyl-(Acyl carrier protein) reductase